MQISQGRKQHCLSLCQIHWALERWKQAQNTLHLSCTTVLQTGSELSLFYKWGSWKERNEASLSGATCQSLLSIATQLCLSLHPAETWCTGPVSSLWLICSQRPNSTFWYLPPRVPGAWLALSGFVKWICCHCWRICYNHPSHPGDGFGHFWIYFETSLQVNLEICIRAGEMAQPAKALAASPGNLSLFPRTHVIEERTDSHISCLLIYTQTHHGTHAPPNT